MGSRPVDESLLSQCRARSPAGPKGRFAPFLPYFWGVWNFSKNKEAAKRLLDAMDAFAQFSGPLRPHFAYGELTKPQYERAHLMHLANHWTQFQAKTAVA